MSTIFSLPAKENTRRFFATIAAIIIGLLVTELGLTLWSLDLYLLPPVAACALMLGVLWAYLRYFSGNGFRSVTIRPSSSYRKLHFRSWRLPARTWQWSILAAVLIVIVLETGLALVFRLIPFPEAAFKTEYRMLDAMPGTSAWIIVVLSSMVAGICEETGFRGYMQTAMEKRLGPWSAIILSSLAFTLLHLSKSWASSILPLIFLTSFLLGWLAWRTGSILPGIFAHASFDVCNFSYWWSHLAGNYDQKTIFRSGLDWQFVLVSAGFIGALAGFYLVMGKIKKVAR